MCDFIRFLTNVLLDGPILTSQRSFHECRSALCQVLHEEEGVLDSILVQFPALRIRETAITQDTERKYTSWVGCPAPSAWVSLMRT